MSVTIPPARPIALLEWPAHRVAVWAFLINEAFLFGSVLAAGVFLRLSGTVPWPRPGDALAAGPALVATAILIASSATFNESVDAFRRGHALLSRRWLAFSLLLGSIFLVIQGYEWWDLIEASASLAPGQAGVLRINPWGAVTFIQIFFLATGLHGAHVLLGLALMVWLLVSGSRGVEKRLENVALYWHFVDLIWIFILSTLYLL